MLNATKCFSATQQDLIRQAVGKAESATSAEIVPVVATASGRYDRAEDIAGLWLGVIAMSITWAMLPLREAPSGAWDARPPWIDLLALILAMTVGFIAGAAITSRLGHLRRLFTPRKQMQEEVALRSRQAFFDSRVTYTRGRTGLLIYISLYERLAAILADQTVLAKLGQPALDQLCADLTARLRQGDITAALVSTIEQSGSMLAAVLPPDGENPNELPDGLVTLDG